ncbi:WbuC family cupin fold metalloprotein [Neptunicella sp. SCSIO 80796]|uniref:WbuC family cupin fold metalloprotein n=1 Tax=Neptunicella plasticusilytica TaxID=3117012 RepID=UPI003A4DDFEF
MTIKLFDKQLFTQLAQAALDSPRLRSNHNVHDNLDEPVQRLFITLQPDSYVRPHRHSHKDKWEFFFMVSGELSFLIFDQQGELQQRHQLSADGELRGLEIPYNTWHAVVAGDKPATFFEVKQGPYQPMDDKDFAHWSPAENDIGVNQFVLQLKKLTPGERINIE